MQAASRRNRTGFGALCIGLALSLSFSVAAPAYAATKQAEAAETNPLKAATVNLYCTFSSGSKRFSSSGSGVFISERGVILTNAHVAQFFLLPYKDGKVRGSCNVRTGSPAKNTYTASVLYISPTWLQSSIGHSTGTGEHDFALLYVTGAERGPLPTNFPHLSFNTLKVPGDLEQVAITGYPTEHASYNKVRTKLKEETASSTVTEQRKFSGTGIDVITIKNSPMAASGVSGGPVTNAAGEVVGLATAVSSDKNPSLRAITLPYINRAIFAESSLPLSYYLLSNFPLQAGLMQVRIASTTIKEIKDSLFTKKKE